MDASQSLTQVLDADADVCLSGGADGADLQWGLQAGKAGHGVIHWSFSGHRSQAPEQELVRLTQEQLELADTAVARANISLKRRWPSSSIFTNNLLRRNWYQVKDTQSLYAVAEFSWDKGVSGGTAWAVQMYLDRFLIDGEPMEQCKVYVLDKNSLHWHTWDGTKWTNMLSRPPKPSGLWTGIGSRELSALARVEIRKLMGTYVLDEQQLASLFPIVEEPKVNDIIYVPDHKVPGQGAMNRAGGWATVRRLSTGDRLWVSVVEFSNNEEFDWNMLKDQQIALRKQFGTNRAMSKPDFSPENNKTV